MPDENLQYKIISSENENVSKLVFFFDGAVAEAVLYKYPTYKDRVVICCSTQSGCPVGCRFCGAGDHFVRSLTAEEICYQVAVCMLKVWQDEDVIPSEVKRGQIMFMSMGEPLLNYDNLSKAIDELSVKYPNFQLLISTSGPKAPEKFEQLNNLSMEYSKIGLQFSVHESTDESRNKLIPFKGKMTLEEIAKTGEAWVAATGRKAFFNYCVHEKNNTLTDVSNLLYLFDPDIWEVTLSVVCERDEQVAAANKRQEQLVKVFMDKMTKVGYSCRQFNPSGQDTIGGGCGQLWFVQEWMRNNPKYTKRSAGTDLPKVHTPRELIKH